MTQELMGLLAELKRGVPFFSGRYKGHMSFEQTLASQLGYFAAMLYNPNNVAFEGSPVTTRLELEVAADLMRMIGYDPNASWGHITSGGTVANFEALWIARNIAYLPLAVAGAANELGVQLDVTLPGGSRAAVNDLPLWKLVNISNAAALDLWHALFAAAPREQVQHALSEHSLATVGYQDYAHRLEKAYGDPLPAGVVLVAATAHYSWEKIVRALGIGSNQIVYVPVDAHYRMDPDALWERVREHTKRRAPVMACISVCGTTEESAVDRLDAVLAVRERAEKELGVTYHVHSDACYGGYAASVTWTEHGERRAASEIRKSLLGLDWPTEDWVRAMEALGRADSVTIDPHKLGYCPYPAGAFLLRDRRARDLVSTDPPYLAPVGESGGGAASEERFLGRYIFEGSKPGASAASVWLSHKVLPLNERGYGHLIERTVLGARRLHAALGGESLGEFRAVMLPEPDINIVCWVMHHPSLKTLDAVNALNEAIYERMSLARPGAQPEYIITRTRFQSPMYDGAVDPLLQALGVCTAAEWKANGASGLVVLRSTVMDPFLVSPPPAPDHVRGFRKALIKAAESALRTVTP
jgi:glutamate/tyrosine decarboxylase-like PLP-dependent enzyme